MSFRVVIPARYASTRLPGKPLRLIAGRTMLERVHERALAAGADEVWVATDDPRIESACRDFGARVLLTDPRHPSGTDRLAEVARRLDFAPEDIVVNVQGDEPLLAPANVAQVAALLAATPAASIATLATPITSPEDHVDPNVVKVVRDAGGLALYFSRAPIPWNREAARHGLTDARRYAGALRHVGLYAYRARVLGALASLAPTALEMAEQLEQLRALENGLAIAVGLPAEPPGPGVDTEEDLDRVTRLLLATGS